MASTTTLDNTNLLLNRQRNYVHCSSYRGFARNAVDGNPQSGWTLPNEEASGWLDASLGLATTVNCIVLREDGDRIRSYDLQAYDGGVWESIARGTTLGTKTFAFAPRKASAFRVEITTTGGGGIAELEVYDTTRTSPLPGYPSRKIAEAFAEGRIALCFGSPYALTFGGVGTIDPRDLEVRLLPDSGRYLIDVIRCLVHSLGGAGEWDERDSRFCGKLRDREIAIKIPAADALQTKADILGVLGGVCASTGLSLVTDPDFPSLVLCSPPAAESLGPDALGEVAELLSKSDAVVSREAAAASPGPDAVVTPDANVIVGKTLKWVGFRGSVIPGTNDAAWLNYYRPNALRTWYGAALFGRYTKLPSTPIETIEDFDQWKSTVRSAPDTSELIDWQSFLSRYHESKQKEFAVYRKLGIDIVNETGAKNWPNNWSEHFKAWLTTYAATYYLAKNFDVEVHQYGNEPDRYLRDQPDEEIAIRFQLVSDAVHCAIEDVNQRFNKSLRAQFAAPVLAGDPVSHTARAMMRTQRTDYHGRAMDRDLVQYFNRHRYGDRARQNVLEVERTKKMMLEESPTGRIIPQIFTELNYSTGANWARPHITYTSDSPQVIHSLASIWGQMTAAQGVQGIFLFKWAAENIKWSNTVCYKFVRESDERSAAAAAKGGPITDIGYVTKNAEIVRLFGEGFSNAQDLLETQLRCTDPNYQAYTTYNPRSSDYYIWTVQVNDVDDYLVELDLSNLDVLPGTPITIREIGAASFGEVIYNTPLPGNRMIRWTQPKQSAWLVTIPRDMQLRIVNLPAVAAATVTQGTHASESHGPDSLLHVQRHANPDRNRITFLGFDTAAAEHALVHRAMLRVHGRRRSPYDFDDGFTFRVYGINNDTWDESRLNALNAPNVHRTVSSMAHLPFDCPPVGHMTFTGGGGFAEIDVTRFVREHGDRKLSFVLIRELKWPGENTDFAWADLESRSSGPDLAPRLQLLMRDPGAGDGGG